MSGQIAALEPLQHRAFVEPRRHLVALVEYAFGVAPEMAERLIPHALVEDAERVDCEKPIRDENGQFLGCEPGGGAGGNGAGGASKTESTEARWAREKKEDIDRHRKVIASHREAVKVPAGKFSEAAEKHKETVLRAREMNDETAENAGWHIRNRGGDFVAKEEEMEKLHLQEEVDAIAHGHVTPPPREKLDRYLEVQRPAMQKRLDRIHQSVVSDHRDLEQAVADLRDVDGLGDLPTEGLRSARAEAGNEDYVEAGDDAPSESELEELEPKHDDDAEDYNSSVDEYNKAAVRIHKDKQEAVKKARDVAARVLSMQEEHLNQFKAFEADHKKIAKDVEKEGDVDSSELLSEEARRILDEEDETYEGYEQADNAAAVAARMAEGNSRDDLTNMSTAADAVKSSMSDTKKIIKALDKYIAKKQAPPTLLEHRPDEEEEDDGDEE